MGKTFTRMTKRCTKLPLLRNLTGITGLLKDLTDVADCDQYDYEDMMTEELGELARCTYLRNDLLNRKPFPLLKHIWRIKQACNQLTVERLPTCFYHIIKTLREYPDAPELESVTKEMLNTSLMPGNFKFEDTPPALAYLLHDAMRSAYGKFSVNNMQPVEPDRVLALDAWTRTRVTKHCSLNCEKATDEDIIEKWEWVAACRFKKNGPVDSNHVIDAKLHQYWFVPHVPY